MLLIKNIFNLLDKKEKNGLYVLMVMVFFSMILETLSIGAIIPILTSVFDQGSMTNGFFWKIYLKLLDILTETHKLYFQEYF